MKHEILYKFWLFVHNRMILCLQMNPYNSIEVALELYLLVFPNGMYAFTPIRVWEYVN